MASQDEDRRIFGIVRQDCVNLSRIALAPAGVFDPSSKEVSEALRELYTGLKNNVKADSVLSTNLADYIFVPLSYLLKQPKLGDVQTTYLLRILALLLRHCWSAESTIPYVLAKQFFPLITFLTGGPPNAKDNAEAEVKSDELKTAGAEALGELFISFANQKEAKIYDFFDNVENLPALGHAVTVLLSFVLNGGSIELQTQSLKTLDTLYFRLIDDGEILSYILPGNVSTLTKVIASPGNKVHYTVLVQAIQVLGKLLVLVYDDETLKTDFKELESIEELTTDDFQMDEIILRKTTFQKVHRTKSWLKATSAQVKLALENVKKVQSHSKFEVQQTLLQLSQSLLKHCVFSLKSSIPILIEIIAFLSKDARLTTNLTELVSSESPKHQSIILKALANELDTRVESFSSVIQSPNESKIISTINAIKFSLKNSNNIFIASKLIDSTLIELSDLLNKSLKPSKITYSTSSISDLMLITNDFNSSRIQSRSMSVYDRIMTRDVQLALSGLFQTLGESLDITDFVDVLFTKENVTLVEKGVILWISSNLIQGYINNVKPDVIVNEFLQFDENENDVAIVSETPEFVYSLLEYSKRVLEEIVDEDTTVLVEQVNSVALDSIGIIADFLGQDFKHELIDYLYPVIESLASPSDVVREHALNTSLIIADNIYSGSLYNLILDNSDYLVDAISIRLSGALTDRTTAILAVCVKIAGFQIMESFGDVMEIIFNILDFYHGYADICIGFFILFEIIADEITKKYLYDQDLGKIEYPDNTSSFSPWGMKNVNQLLSLLDKSNRDILIAPQEPTDNDIEEIERDSDDEGEDTAPEALHDKQKDEWLSPVPKDAYKLLQQIVYYGERLLTHPSPKLHVQILKTYNKALPIFATQMTNLYPIAASIWPIVSHLVTSNDPKVVTPAAQLVSRLIEYTGTFLNDRFIAMWSRLKKNELLASTSKQSHTSRRSVVLPGLNSKCFESLKNMLMIALERLGKRIPDSIIQEIVLVFVGTVPDLKIFNIHQDMAWILKCEIYGFEGLEPPQELKATDGKIYKFAALN